VGAVAAAADGLGFDSVWVSDHVVWPVHYDSVYPYGPGGKYPGDENTPACEAVSTMAWLSARTERVRIGTCVLIVPQREPWLLAKQLGSIDRLNGGRTVLGAGVGWLREEFEVLGAPFDDRVARSREAIELMRTVWGQQPARFDGEFWTAPPVGVLPHPVQQPIPVLHGGNSRSAQRRVATYGDGWLPFGLGPEEISTGLAYIAEQAAAAGRDGASLRSVLWSPLLLDEDVTTPMVPLHGTGNQLIEALGAYAAAGLDEFVMFNLAPGDMMVAQLEALAKDVLPAVHAL
jgi:probable F420-dependent oxidoreductase